MNAKRPTLVVLAGPTAVGKTELALSLAEALQSPIISADSRQVYAELQIGTAAPTAQQLQRVKHYMVGHRSIADYYSAYEFEQDVLALLADLFAQHRAVVMTGGSMMYIDAVCNGIDDIPTISDEVRQHVASLCAEHGAEYIQQMLLQLDPEFYHQVDLCNTKRVVHAVEVCLMSGQTYTSLRTNTVRERPFDILRVALDRPRPELFERIDSRVDQMMTDGLEEEARRFYPQRHLNSLNTVGYKELFQYFDGDIPLDEALRLIKRNTRRYAKKQLTWFRLRNSYEWFHPNDAQQLISYVQERLK